MNLLKIFRKKRFAHIIVILAWAFTSVGCARYSRMEDAFETYNYPVPQYNMKIVESSKGMDNRTESFTDTKNNLENAYKNWKKIASTPVNMNQFFTTTPFQAQELANWDSQNILSKLEKPLTLEALEVITIKQNPAIKGAQKKFQAAIESINQVTNLDEILYQYTAFTENVMTGIGPMKGKSPADKKFPFPGITSLKGQIAHKNVQAAQMDFEIAVRDKLTELKTTYFRFVYVEQSVSITKQMVKLLNHLENVATTRYESGKTNFQDVIKVRIKREIITENLQTFIEKRKTLDVKLREILDIPHDQQFSLVLNLHAKIDIPSLPDLYQLALSHRQELNRLKYNIEKMERMIEMAESMIVPPYTMNLSLFEDETLMQVGTFSKKDTFPIKTLAQRGAGLPKMPWYGMQDAYLNQVRKKLAAQKLGLKNMQNKTTSMVRKTWATLDQAKRETLLYDNKIIKLSESALDVSSKGYESGNVPFADVIGSYTIWLKSNLMFHKKLSDLNIAFSELARVVGKKLPKEINAKIN